VGSGAKPQPLALFTCQER